MEKILTISIAAYNVSAYIKECLDSLVKCSYLDALDIVVVDDGSHDNTVEIVQKYVSKYPDSIRLVRKENGGHGSTINRAVSVAKGKYFKVLDGDDWVDAVELDKLLEVLRKISSDLVLSNYTRCVPGNYKTVDYTNLFITDTEISMSEYNNRNKFEWISMHAIVIRTDVYRNYGFRISEKQFYVDVEFIYFSLVAAKTIYYSSVNVTQYRLGRSGQSVSLEGAYKNISDNIKVAERITNMYYSKTYSIEGKEAVLYDLVKRVYKSIFVWFSLFKNNEKDNLLKQMDINLLQKYPQVRKIPLEKYKVVRYNYKLGLGLLRFLRKITGKEM